AGATCTYEQATHSGSFNSLAATSSVVLTTLTGCVWSVSNPNPWISVLSSVNNSNSGSVTYSVQSNPTALPRVGVINIDGLSFAVTQLGATCTYTLATNSALQGAGADTNSVGLTTLTGCVWNVSSAAPWLNILSPLNNSNSGTVTYSVLANPTALWRTGIVTIAGQPLAVAQSGASCSYTLA